MDIPASDLWPNISHFISSGMNDWGGVHPTVVHFPIALLTVAPLFVILGLICQKSARTFFTCALVLMLLGAAGTFLAASTGEEAAEALEPNPAIIAPLEAHEELGELCRSIYSLFSGLFLAYVLFYPSFMKKFSRTANNAAVFFFLIMYSLSLILLFNAAHYGGTLVHKHKLTSTLYFK